MTEAAQNERDRAALDRSRHDASQRAAAAPFINNTLIAGGALMTASSAITHPSQPNYLAFFSGSTQGVTTDSVYPHSQFTGPNLAAIARG